MALGTNVYRALEDIVGTENISREAAVLESYTRVWATAAMTRMPRLPRPGAVVLPATIEEVQAIVKTCNKYKVKFKALSTGWMALISPGPDGVQIDLRRMNRILEINEKNMYAVVEPYVISAQLQGELMKRGLNFNVSAAGPQTTALAPTKACGVSQSAVSTGHDNRNMLAIEWVLPTGEILRTGSLGSGAGWFCGEGPGPSVRGIARGSQGAYGGIGVFTKAAIKLFHWPGPRNPEVEGISPHYKFKAPETFKLHCISFPSWEKVSETMHRISESEIAAVLTRVGPWLLAFNIGNSNKEAFDLLSRIRQSSKGRIICVIIIIAASQKEFDYKEKVLQKIVSETEGEPLTFIEEADIAEPYLWHFTRQSRTIAECFRATCAYIGTLGGTEALLPLSRHMAHDTEVLKQLIKEGVIMDDVGDSMWGCSFEGGHYYNLQYSLSYSETPESLEGVGRLIGSSFNAVREGHYPIPMFGTGDEVANLWGPHCSNYHLWVRKIKKAFDPNGVSEASAYVTADE